MTLALDILGAILLVLGSSLILIAAIGVLRFPDTLARAHALGVASSLGILCVMLGMVVGLRDLGGGAKAVLTVIFITLTAPVGSHMLGRAAYRFGQFPLDLRKDELAESDEGIDEASA